jgi:hypothetical protein
MSLLFVFPRNQGDGEHQREQIDIFETEVSRIISRFPSEKHRMIDQIHTHTHTLSLSLSPPPPCSDAAQDRTCTARAVVRSGHRTTARAVKKN